MSTKYKLMWLNNSLEGRVLHLPEGNLTIGPDGDVLAQLVDASSVDLLIDEEGIWLEQMVPAWIEGKKQEELTQLPLGQVVELAGVAMIFALANDPLVMRPVPAHQEKKAKKNYWLLSLGLLFTMLSLMCVGVMLMYVMPAQTATPPTPAQWLASQLKQPDLRGIAPHWGGNGVVTLDGYCQNSQQMTEFLNRLASRRILYRVNSVCTDQLVSDVQSVLQQNSFRDAQVLPGKTPGSVVIAGSIQSGPQWDKTATMLDTVAGLVSWQVVNNMDAQIKPLIAQLRAAKLLAGLMVARDEDNIMISGKVSEQQQQQVMQIADRLEKSVPGSLPSVFQNIPVQERLEQILQANIVSYGGNAESWFVELSNGVKLTSGMRLDNGYVIQRIDENGMDLTLDDEQIHIPLIL